MMNKSQVISFILSVLGGLLLVVGWPPLSFPFVLLIAFVPLFLLSIRITKSLHFFLSVLLTMLIWNVGTTWWLWNSTAAGAIGAIGANSLLMCLPWLFFFHRKQRTNLVLALIEFICIWLLFEHIHLRWELSWPWLTLGNGFANATDFVQWYEYTGIAGGSLFIVVENCLVFALIYYFHQELGKRKLALIGLSALSIPIFLLLWSKQIENKWQNNKTTELKNIVAIQPNIDPYQKFSIETADDQVNNLLALTTSAIDTNTVAVLWPETAMSVGEWQDLVAQNQYYKPIFDFAKKHPSSTIISGIETYKNYGTEKQTNTARRLNNGNYYDAFNAAIQIKDSASPLFYNKSKLVPGVEALPSFLNVLAPLFEKFGGTTGGYGRSDSAIIFSTNEKKCVIAPIICYESIYGNYVRQYVQKGATVLGIITNDGWWGNTPGYHQHLAYAKLRAIENRRWVVRGANTGISAVINERGEIVTALGWDKKGFIKEQVPYLSVRTFYTEYGDTIYEWVAGAAFIFLSIALYQALMRRFFSNTLKK